MKRSKLSHILLICASLLLVLLLAVSCGGNADETDTQAPTEALSSDNVTEIIPDDQTHEAQESADPDTEATDVVSDDTAQPQATQAPVAGETEAGVATQAPQETQAPATQQPAETKAPPKPAETDAPETKPVGPIKVVVAQKENINFNKTVTISQSGGTSTVKAQNGLTYTASGYSAVSNGRFTFNQGFSISLDPAKTNQNFNRFTICYVSTQPLKGTITYTENGQTRTDNFFLEAGDHTFSCVIVNYLTGKMGKGITKMTFSTCNGQNTNFALCLLKTEEYPVYTSGRDDTYYIENDRFKLGVRLSWGGGINYLRDYDGQRGLTNLINNADTGRLVQQSYYGTQKEGSYQAGSYNNAQWKYNPVQGGDVYQNHSRIIDIVVNEYSVYVKSQPQDWSLNNQITPSYMENSYTLYADYIRVDNRFVDFSGMTHPFTSQELPAFYTVSALSRFFWYDGSDGWTNDNLSYRDDLNFWGDPNYHNDCTTFVRRSNTETWCAWVHPTTNYGIGLYVPNIDSLLAGKYEYNGSGDPKNGATNYVAPVNNMKLVAYEPLEYSYLMTTGKIADIRATFQINKDFASNASLHKNYRSARVADIPRGSGNAGSLGLIGGSGSGGNSGNSGGNSGNANTGPYTLTFNSANSISTLNPVNLSNVTFDASRNAAKLTATGADTQVDINYGALGNFTSTNYTTLIIEYMLPTSNVKKNYNTDLFICAGSYTEAAEGCRTREALVTDGQWHTLTVNLSAKSFWSGALNKIRFDFFDMAEAGDVMYVRSITIR